MANFKVALQKKIETTVRMKIMPTLVEILASHDIIIASSLDMEVKDIVYNAALAELNKLLKDF